MVVDSFGRISQRGQKRPQADASLFAAAEDYYIRNQLRELANAKLVAGPPATHTKERMSFHAAQFTNTSDDISTATDGSPTGNT